MKNKIEISRRKLFGIVAIAIILSSVFSIGTYVLATTYIPTFTTGAYPGSQSYTIYPNGTGYCSKNADGHIDFAGTDFTALFTSTENALPSSGGKIFLRAGDYSGGILIQRSNIIVEGEGVHSDVGTYDPGDTPTYLSGTVIKPTSGQNGIWIAGHNLSNVQVRNLGIWFTTSSTGHGITTDTDQQFHLRDGAFENIMVLNNDRYHYALRFSNFLFVGVRHVLSWGGPLLEIYANLPSFHQGNSVWEDIYGNIKYDLAPVTYSSGPYPIFIHRNDAVTTTWTNLMEMRRIQVNIPYCQSDSNYQSAIFWALKYSTVIGLDIEGVTSTKRAVEIGSNYNVHYDSVYVWAQYANVSWNSASNSFYNLYTNMVINGDITDGSLNGTWVSPSYTGIITSGTKAKFTGIGFQSSGPASIPPSTSVTFNHGLKDRISNPMIILWTYRHLWAV